MTTAAALAVVMDSESGSGEKLWQVSQAPETCRPNKGVGESRCG